MAGFLLQNFPWHVIGVAIHCLREVRDMLADLMLKFVEALERCDLCFAGEVEPKASTMNREVI